MDEQPPSQAPKALIAFLVVLILVAAGFLFYRRSVVDQGTTPVSEKQGQQRDGLVYDGSLTLRHDENRSVFAIDEEIALTLYADSAGQAIGGYDVVFSIGQEDATLVSVESLIPEFQLSTNDMNGNITMHGVKDFAATSEYVFQGEPIVTVTFLPKRSGEIAFNFAFEEGVTSDSNLVKTSTEDVLGMVTGFTAYIGDIFHVTSGQTVSVDNDVSFTFNSIQYPSAECADCFTEIAFSVGNGSDSEEGVFQLGGFEGRRTDSQEALGYVFELVDVSDGQLTIRYSQQTQ